MRFKNLCLGGFMLALECGTFPRQLISADAEDGAGSKATTDSSWVAQGPGPAQNGQVEGSTITDWEVSGAIHTIAAHPADEDILYIGAVNGGVWKTIDATSASPTWTPLTDTQASQSIGALEFDPTDGTNQTLVAGIGRASSFGRSGGRRTGLLKTVNGGASWAALDGGLNGKNISGVAPRGATLVVSVNDGDIANNCTFGVYRSANNGTTFTQLTAAAGVPPGVAFDLASDRSSISTLYTAIIFGSECSGSALTNGIYRSTDTGASWAKVSNGAMDALISDAETSNVEIASDGMNVFVDIINTGRPVAVYYSSNGTTSWSAMDLPRTPVGRSNAIISPGRTLIPGTPIVIDLGTATHQMATGTEVKINDVEGTTGANGVWAITVIDANSFSLDGSGDAAAWTTSTGSWHKVHGVSPSFKAGGQGGNHASIVIDPTTGSTVYMGGDRQDPFPGPDFIGATNFTGRLFRGDATVAATGAVPSPQWNHLTHLDNVTEIPNGGTDNRSAPHADSREMVFDATGDLIESDDGGVYRRTSPTDNTGDWFSLNGNLQVNEQHDVAYDSLSDIIISGNQDTGTTQQITTDGLTWTSVSTGDGGDVGVDDTTDGSFSTRFSSFQNHSVPRRRVYNAANALSSNTSQALAITPPDEIPIYPFITPMEINAITQTSLVIAGCNAVYESLDQGDTLNQIPGLLETGCLTGEILGRRQNAVAYGGVSGAVDNEDILYVGAKQSLYVRTAADPAALTELANYPTITDPNQIQDVVLDPDDWKTVFVIDNTGVQMSTDTGATWLDISGNLGAGGAEVTGLHAAAFIPGSPDILVVGGRKGIFSLDLSHLPDSMVWAGYGTGLPNVPVWDMDYDASDEVLVAGTLGRGSWKISTAAPPGPEFDSTPAADITQEFGDQFLNTESNAIPIKVDNLGDENLTVACELIGANLDQFDYTSCTSPVSPAEFITIQATCTPTSIGQKTATLKLTTNDPDESAPLYPLQCTGSNTKPELIHEDGFETENP
jgi:hypothetical protein